jgi:7-cyano-7-deazaguanine synthase in queuosine biosynthesis
MQFWIDKEQESQPDAEWEDSYIFSINRKKYSTIFTNITDSWYRMDQIQIPSIYEDLFIIGLSIFALDKRVSRRKFKDCWTREINVSIPVLEYDKWKETSVQWEKMLKFLTGDHWHVVFRKSEIIYSYRKHPNRIHLNVQACNCVCLFSGGLDSLCGAIRLLEEGASPCLIGHNEYPKLGKKQDLFAELFQSLYPEQTVKFISFTANSRAPISAKEGRLKGSENTSRGRSLLFLCAAFSVAGVLGKNVPVYIPENGFIGLNIPLTGGRKGTCSTRTTHPYFLRQFNAILQQVGIENTITNFFAYNTKREIVNQVKHTEAFRRCYADTISCSYPCLARYNKNGSKEYPINCGYCYPCLIRKSSLLDIQEEKKYSYQGEAFEFLMSFEESEKSADLRAILGSIYRCKHLSDKELKRYIKCVGELSEDEVEKFLTLYKKSIDDLVQLFSEDKRMKEYLGV